MTCLGYMSLTCAEPEQPVFEMQESKGTVLSTNWKDIGSKKVTAAPPDGMEKEKF